MAAQKEGWEGGREVRLALGVGGDEGDIRLSFFVYFANVTSLVLGKLL